MGPAVRLLGCIRGRPGVVTTADSQRFYPTLLRPSVGSPCGLSSVLPRGSVPGAGGRSGAPVGPAAQWVYRTQGQRVTDRICLDRCGPSLGRMCVCVCVCARRKEPPLQARFKQSRSPAHRGIHCSQPRAGTRQGPCEGSPRRCSEPFHVAGTLLPCPPWKNHPSSACPRVPAPEALPTAPHKAPSATSLPSSDSTRGSLCAEALAVLGNAPDGGRMLASTAVLHRGLLGTYSLS